MANHFSLSVHLKHKTKLLRSHGIFNNPMGMLAEALGHSSDIACFLPFLSHGDFSYLVLSLAIFPNILWFILAIICLYVELFISYLTYFL